jgi:ATP-dependent Clp protease ATP-binding subunit ClpA
MFSFDRFTIKAQEIVKNAFNFARDLAHQQIDPEHFLLAALSTVNFKNTLIIITSNLGSQAIMNKMASVNEDNGSIIFKKS